MLSKEKINSIAVIGTGTMGKGIVQVLAECEQVDNINWKGRSPLTTEQSKAQLAEIWALKVKKNRMSEELAASSLKKVNIVNDYSQLYHSNLIIEAISENIEEKKSIFTEIAKISSENMILASNTSSLSITELASLTEYPENVIGFHFFNPAPVMKLTEIIVGHLTSKSTLDKIILFSKILGKEPVVVNEAPGFIVNRMLIPMINEAIGMLAEGVATSEEIDKAMRYGANHPIGPLALADLIGNDVNLSIMETLYNETGDPKYRAHALLRKMVRANHLGRKTGKGFYNY
ncbi:3-hydroxyacyl-CoA dehydrogenase family protein [Pseudomonas gingeri]